MITFKSRATASVLMFDEVGKRLLDIMGKTPDKTGIITLAQLPQAIANLRHAAEEDRKQPPAEEDEEAEKIAPPRPISLAQRAVPLIDLLTESLAAEEPVVWE